MSYYRYPEVELQTYPNMLVAADRIRVAQLTKLIECVRMGDHAMIERIVSKGYPRIVDHVHPESGETCIGLAASLNAEVWPIISYGSGGGGKMVLRPIIS